jgi:hypothetical protein
MMQREKVQVRQHEAESIDALVRGGLPRSSDEAVVMPVERRGWVTRQERRSTGNRTSLTVLEGGSLRRVARAV